LTQKVAPAPLDALSAPKPRGRPPKNLAHTTHCVAIKQDGKPCSSAPRHGSLCLKHAVAMADKGEMGAVRCHRCPLAKWKKGADGKPSLDLEGSRINCPKAFWNSDGEQRNWGRDYCWWDREMVLLNFDQPQELFMSMVRAVEAGDRLMERVERLMAANGGQPSSDWFRLREQQFRMKDAMLRAQMDLAKELREAKTGLAGSLRALFEAKPADERKDLLRRLMEDPPVAPAPPRPTPRSVPIDVEPILSQPSPPETPNPPSPSVAAATGQEVGVGVPGDDAHAEPASNPHRA